MTRLRGRLAQDCCANCNAWAPNAQANPPSGKPRQGWCRASPPMLVQTMQQVNAIQAGGPTMVPAYHGVWPPVNSDMWCRAYEQEEAADERLSA